MKRRSLLIGAAATGAALALPRPVRAETPLRLTAAPGEAGLVVPDGPATKAWLYNGTAPGPILRARQGDTLLVDFTNALPEPTTVHWHGLRVPVSEDGMPGISQPPVMPGETHRYTLPLLDAGTFWYHPHMNSSEQVGRGLHGLLIVDEPPQVAAALGADRELTWVLDDWRLDDQAQIAPFGNMHDASHGGRFGNVLTVNGSYLTRTDLRAGERIRLRIANVANAQSFRLNFAPFDPWIVALDGHPVAPTRLGDGRLWLGAGQRADLVLDVTAEPGTTARVIDDTYGPDRAFEVMTWSIAADPPLRDAPLPAPFALPSNPVALPVADGAQEHTLVFDGGAMGQMQGAMMGGRMMTPRDLAAAGRFWAVNGAVPGPEPLLRLALGQSHRIRLENRTRWLHPIHLHGHSFALADPRQGGLAALRDTVLLAPEESVDILVMADNPGLWMLHCHVLEHQETGMMGIVEVA